MKEHFCPAEQSMIAFEKECNWCGESEGSMTQEALKLAHWSDCAVHREPAYPNGECDCGGIVAVADYTALSDKYVALSDKYVALKAQRTEQLKACVYCGQLVAKEKNT